VQDQYGVRVTIVPKVRLVMNHAVGNQSDLSTTYKPMVTTVKAANREGSEWEKGEVSQLILSVKF